METEEQNKIFVDEAVSDIKYVLDYYNLEIKEVLKDDESLWSGEFRVEFYGSHYRGKFGFRTLDLLWFFHYDYVYSVKQNPEFSEDYNIAGTLLEALKVNMIEMP